MEEKLMKQQLTVNQAFEAVPENFDIKSVNVYAGEIDQSENVTNFMTKSEILAALNKSRYLLDENQITCVQVIWYIFELYTAYILYYTIFCIIYCKYTILHYILYYIPQIHYIILYFVL